MFFPNFPIVFVFPFRLHFELKYIFSCFICKKQIARFRGQSILPAYCSSLPCAGHSIVKAGTGFSIFHHNKEVLCIIYGTDFSFP